MRLPYYEAPDGVMEDATLNTQPYDINDPKVAISHIRTRRSLRPEGLAHQSSSEASPDSQSKHWNLALDRALLHSPPFAYGWSTLLGAIRDNSTLPADITELIMCRVAALNGSVYEWKQHMPLLRKAFQKLYETDENLQPWLNPSGDPSLHITDVVEAVKDCPVDAFLSENVNSLLDLQPRLRINSPVRQWTLSPRLLTPFHISVLASIDSLTMHCKIPDVVWDQLKQFLSDYAQAKNCNTERVIVEITGTISAYNMVSRFLTALDVGEAGSWPDDDSKLLLDEH